MKGRNRVLGSEIQSHKLRQAPGNRGRQIIFSLQCMDTTVPAFQRSNFSLNFDCKAYPSFRALKLLQAKIWELEAKNCFLLLQPCPSPSISKSSSKPEPFPAEQLRKSPSLAVLCCRNNRGGAKGDSSNQYKQMERNLVLQFNQMA